MPEPEQTVGESPESPEDSRENFFTPPGDYSQESTTTSEETQSVVQRSSGWVWAPTYDGTTTEFNAFITSTNRLTISPQSSEVAITGMRIVLSNHFAPLPICGHEYASVQFLGRGPTEFSIQVANLGTRFLEGFQIMLKETERNAREFRGVKGCSYVRFAHNEFLGLAGIEKGMVQGFSTETDARGTNLYVGNISFTVDGDFQESLQQEGMRDSSFRYQVLETLLGFVIPFTRSVPYSLNSITAGAGRSTRGTIQRGSGSDIARPGARVPIASSLLRFYVPAERRAARAELAASPSPPEGEGTSPILNGDEATEEPGPSDFDMMRAELRRIAAIVPGTVAAAEIDIAGYAPMRSVDVAIRQIPGSGIVFTDEVVRQIDFSTTYGLWEATRYAGDSRFRAAEGDLGATRPDVGGFSVFVPPDGGAPLESGLQDSSVVSRLNVAGRFVFRPNCPNWLQRYVGRVCAELSAACINLPPRSFFSGPNRGQYYYFQGVRGAPPSLRTGRVVNWPRMFLPEGRINSLMYGWRLRYIHNQTETVMERNMRLLEENLLSIARDVLLEFERPDFDTLFPGVFQGEAASANNSIRPAYPDISLPPHPVTGSVLDTEPDFFVWNDGEEEMLTEIGPTIANEMDYRLESMGRSYYQLQSADLWRLFNTGSSRLGAVGPDGSDLRDEGGALSPLGTQEQDSNALSPAEFTAVRELAQTIGTAITQNLALSPRARASTRSDTLLAQKRDSIYRNFTLAVPGLSDDPVRIGPASGLVTAEDESQSLSRDMMQSRIMESVLQSSDNTLTLRRAYPTFKLYFIEDDTGPDRQYSTQPGLSPIAYFDDFYNYNSVKEIRLVRTRKQPSSLLIVSLTNVSGILQRRRWSGHQDERQNEPQEVYTPGLDDTELENPLRNLMLKEGLKVVFKQGYSNNPAKLHHKFTGEIVEVSFNGEVADEITIICQDFGSELVSEKKGALPEEVGLTFHTLSDCLHTLMCAPELVHFGRYEVNPNYNPGEARSALSSGDVHVETSVLGGLVPPNIAAHLRSSALRLNSRYFIGNNPADDNIYCLPESEVPYADILLGNISILSGQTANTAGRSLDRAANILNFMGMIPGFRIANWFLGFVGADRLPERAMRSLSSWLLRSPITINGLTIWEVFKEAELRFPGWVSHPRPYGSRMTMFYGLESQNYWASPITQDEETLLQRFRTLLRQYQASMLGTGRAYVEDHRDLYEANRRLIGATGFLSLWSMPWYALDYRDILLRLSFHQSAETSGMVAFGERAGRTFGRFRPFKRFHLATSSHHIILNNIRASQKGTFNEITLYYGDGEAYTLKADDDIPDERVRGQEVSMPGVSNEWTARRVCVGLLRQNLQDVYKGELIVSGMNVDPYDSVFISDDRVGMYGMVGVEQVVDTFTPETGWITEITPDMVVTTNDFSLATTESVYRAFLSNITQRYSFLPSPGVIGAAWAATAPAPFLLASFGGYQFVRWSQDLNPISISPLILGERPFFAGLDNFNQQGVLASLRGRFNSEVDDITKGWRAFHLHGHMGTFLTGVTRDLAGQGGL